MILVKGTRTSATLAVALLVHAAAADAHDIRGASRPDLTLTTRALAQVLSSVPTADVSTRSVLSNLRLWTVPRKLTICFVDGSPALRQRVTEAMRRLWPLENLADGRLDYDVQSFANAPACAAGAADIKVAFVPGDGHWSYVGIESLQHNPSMNFDGLTETTPERAAFDGIVGHELGHALGLEHEHQSPSVRKDCGWNFDYLRTAYQWKSDDDMMFNFKQLQDYLEGGRHAYIFSSYDRRSIMHYSFPPQAFIDGRKSTCFVQQESSAPSDQDLAAIRVAYGTNIVATQATARDAIPGIWDRLSSPQYTELRRLLTLKANLLSQ